MQCAPLYKILLFQTCSHCVYFGTTSRLHIIQLLKTLYDKLMWYKSKIQRRSCKHSLTNDFNNNHKFNRPSRKDTKHFIFLVSKTPQHLNFIRKVYVSMKLYIHNATYKPIRRSKLVLSRFCSTISSRRFSERTT